MWPLISSEKLSKLKIRVKSIKLHRNVPKSDNLKEVTILAINLQIDICAVYRRDALITSN